MGILQNFLAELDRFRRDVAFDSDSSSNLTTRTRIKKRSHKKTRRPKFSPIQNCSASSSKSESDAVDSEFARVLNNLGVHSSQKKDEKSSKNHKSKHSKKSTSSDSTVSSESSNHSYHKYKSNSKKKSRHHHSRCKHDTSSSTSRNSSISSSSNDSDSRKQRKSKIDLTQTYKIMKSFDLKFSGNDNENAELFLEELMDCIKTQS